MLSSSHRQNGFTLLELMVVMFVTALLASTIIVRYRAGQESIARKQGVQLVAQAVRTAQHRALASLCESPPCRMGVHFKTPASAFEIFDDKDRDGAYSAGEEIESYILEGGVLVETLLAGYACDTAVCLDILFDPPDPVTSFQPSGASEVTIIVSGGRSVVVGKGGSIDVN